MMMRYTACYFVVADRCNENIRKNYSHNLVKCESFCRL